MILSGTNNNSVTLPGSTIKNQQLVSVVMCTYNGAKYIDEQMESIIHQDYTNLEIIICDDASTDNTWQKLSEWQKRDERIKIYRNNVNLGYNKNFESAIQKSCGEFIAIADQDDIWMPDKISSLVNVLEQDEQLMLAHCRSVHMINGTPQFKSRKLHYIFHGSDEKKLVFFNHINGHNMIFRKLLKQKLFPLPEKMYYDWWIAFHSALNGGIVALDRVLVYHRIHSDNSFFNNKNLHHEPGHDEIMRVFLSIEGLPATTRIFIEKLVMFIEEQNVKGGKFNMGMFLFFVKNRQTIFGHKKRILPIFNFISNAFKYASTAYNNKGIF